MADADPQYEDHPFRIPEMVYDEDAIRHAFESGEYPYRKKLGRKSYERTKRDLQAELLKVQLWVKQTGRRVVLIFEGRDAAGKGGTIKRFTEHLNPRAARVVALEKPTNLEQGQWYYQRYIKHLPTAGEIVFFDRSWYNRAGVERAMGFCSPKEYLEFMRQTPELERMLVRSGIYLFKYWFSVTREEQKRRFDAREHDPLKQWKLRSHVLLYGYSRRALDDHQIGRQETRPVKLYDAFPQLTELSGERPRCRS